MKEKQKNALLLAYAISELKTRFKVNPHDAIPNYSAVKAEVSFSEQFPKQPTKEDLIEVAKTCYKKLKIK